MAHRWKLRTESFKLPLRVDGMEVASLVEALLALRGVVTDEDRRKFLSPDYGADFHDPFLFSAMPRIMNRLREAVISGERVGIFGDFDADGVTSSVLLREGLEAIGIPVSVYIPHKESEGHGLHRNALDIFEEEGVRLLFTVDCGMMSHNEIAEANTRGMQVIVIDHHHVPDILPEAFAIINPKLPDEPYPFKELCGAGTVFKLLQALYATFLPERKEELKWLLDIAAIGTVADVMPLVGENRIIVTYGLIVLAKTRRPGLQELYAVGRLPLGNGKAPIARDIAFHIAPRINAAGRMAHARLAHDLLVEKNREKARELAETLEIHNAERRKITEAMTEQVRGIASRLPERKFVFAVEKSFPLGIVGLVAGRIANEFHKPTIILTKGEIESRGSLRSIPELHITEVLEECSDILIQFGGHAAAAGLTVSNDRLVELEERLENIINTRLAGIETEPEYIADLQLPHHFITLDLARALRKLAPFGEGNPEPLFWGENFVVEEVRFVGNGEKHMKFLLRPMFGAKRYDGIGFSLGEEYSDLRAGELIDLLFHLKENAWNGSTTVQFNIVDLRRKRSINL